MGPVSDEPFRGMNIRGRMTAPGAIGAGFEGVRMSSWASETAPHVSGLSNEMPFRRPHPG